MTASSSLLLLLLTVAAAGVRSSQGATCDENEFRCKDGFCVDSFLVCDGEKHCRDGSDETKDICSKTQISCQPFAFRCGYGACIDGEKKCDGKQDCADNSDENNSDCSPGADARPPPSTAPSCQLGFFQCESGQCISEYSVCDGTVNCRDGSDETDTLCVNFPCPEVVGFQCTYGGCINKLSQCNGIKDCRDGSDEDNCSPFSSSSALRPNSSSAPTLTPTLEGGCKLPLQPEGGVFRVAGCAPDDVSDKCRRIPNTEVEQFTQLMYRCNEDRLISNPAAILTICANSSWVPPLLPKCLKLCKPLKSTSLDISCTYLGRNEDCVNKRVLPGTVARLQCKQFHRLQGDIISGDPKCSEDGEWTEPLFRCVPECGVRRVDSAIKLISKGEGTSAVEYPWHAGLFMLDPKRSDYDFFCGGSIIAPYMILTAAHCLFESNRTVDKERVRVVVGKTKRPWHLKEPSEQRFSVMEIYIHNDFRGSENNYQFDIAILELRGNIVVGALTMPVCVEWIRPFTFIQNGRQGTVVGWGHDENENLTENLMKVNLTYQDQATCRRRGGVFENYITHDKFCGLYKDGAGVQEGDSGGGLVFPKPENPGPHETQFYYVRGIVSTKPKGEDKYATFTDITSPSNFKFMKEIRDNLVRRGY